MPLAHEANLRRQSLVCVDQGCKGPLPKQPLVGRWLGLGTFLNPTHPACKLPLIIRIAWVATCKNGR
jgi:hypothetical protein